MDRRKAGFIPGLSAFVFLLMPLMRSVGSRVFGGWSVQIALLLTCVASMAVHILYKYRRIQIPVHPLDIFWVMMCVFLLVRNQSIADGYYIDALFYLLAMAYGVMLRCEAAGFAAMRKTMVAFALFYAAITWLSFLAPSLYIARVVPFLPESDHSRVYVAFTQFREYMGLTNHYSRNAYYQTLGMIVLLSDLMAGEPRYRIPKAAMIAFLGATLLLVGKRGHTIFLVFAFLATYVMRRRPSPGTFVKAGGIAAMITLLAALATLLIPGADRLAERLFVADGVDFTTGRSELYARAWAMFKVNPLFGSGWGAFTRSIRYEVVGVHNDYLQLLAEVGIIGTCVVLAANFGTYVMTWRLMRELPGDGGTESLIVLSFFFQTFFLSYSLTGVPHYDFEVYMVYFLLSSAAFAARFRRLRE